MPSVNLSILKDVTEIFQFLFTILAIVIGGSWSYLLFIRRRQIYPRANLKHSIIHRKITNQKNLLHLCVSISNDGEVLISLEKGEVWIHQIIPVTPQLITYIEKGGDPVREGKTEIQWPLLCLRSSKWKKNDFEIEPGETDSIEYDFVIDERIKCVEVYSQYWNTKKGKKDLLWHLTTLHDLN